MTKQQLEEYTNTLDQFSEEGKLTPEERYKYILYLDKLHRYETTLHRLAINACNRDLTAEEDRKVLSTENKVKEIAEELGFIVKFNGDPRGAIIKFYLPSKRSNSWDGETWRIYW